MELLLLTDHAVTEELASLPLEASRRIDVLGFTSPGAIDPLLVSRSYFLVPDATGAHAFAQFHTALRRAGRIAVASITLRQREARATVWPRGSALVLQTLLTPDEIADPGLSEPGNGTSPAQHPDQPAGQQPDLAQLAQQITAMTRDFDPAAHHDGYRDQLEALIQRK